MPDQHIVDESMLWLDWHSVLSRTVSQSQFTARLAEHGLSVNMAVGLNRAAPGYGIRGSVNITQAVSVRPAPMSGLVVSFEAMAGSMADLKIALESNLEVLFPGILTPV